MVPVGPRVCGWWRDATPNFKKCVRVTPNDGIPGETGETRRVSGDRAQQSPTPKTQRPPAVCGFVFGVLNVRGVVTQEESKTNCHHNNVIDIFEGQC